jgi:hypothetical protein
MSPTDSLGLTWPALSERVDPVRGLDRWAAAEPALAGIGTVSELAEIVHNGGDPARADELFGALVRLGAVDGGNEEDAALLVAHLLGNGTRKLALQLRDLSADIDDLLAGELWLQIRAFPWRRRRRAYAKSLLLDTRLAVLAELCPYRNRAGLSRVLLVDPVVSAAYDGAAADCSSLLDRQCFNPHDEDESSLLDLLEWAQRTGVIDRADAALLVELMLAADEARAADQDAAAGRGLNRAREISAVAARHGVHEKTIWRRRARALSALRDASGQYLAAVA